jgi:hypothetical protein
MITGRCSGCVCCSYEEGSCHIRPICCGNQGSCHFRPICCGVEGSCQFRPICCADQGSCDFQPICCANEFGSCYFVSCCGPSIQALSQHNPLGRSLVINEASVSSPSKKSIDRTSSVIKAASPEPGSGMDMFDWQDSDDN